jgi:DNA polymerase I-like protein with 3'-5' exonuclease and polymerase domains
MRQAIHKALLLAHQSLLVMSHLESELKMSSQLDLFVDVEMKLLPILAKMEFYGVGFSQATLFQARGQVEAKIKNLEESTQDHEALGFRHEFPC